MSIEKYKKVIDKVQKMSDTEIKNSIMEANPQLQALFDEDGYPSEQTLEEIVNFPFGNPRGFFELSEKVFNKHYGSWRIVESYENPEIHGDEPLRVIRIATGGWSGNEIVVSAMEKNVIWWVHFVACFRGGLYIANAKGIA